MPHPKDLIAILGLSDDPQRYSHQAKELLQKNGYENLVGVHPKLKDVEGVRVVPRLEDLPGRPHTLTVYLSPDKLEPLIPAILKLNPQRIILNPGTESQKLIDAARTQGIPLEEACTLVLLRTRQF